MDPLVAAYFRRDLNEAEELRLQALVLADPVAAEALAAEAAQRFAGYGQPQGLSSWREKPGRVLAVLALGLALGFGAAWVRPFHRTVQPLTKASVSWKDKTAGRASMEHELGFVGRPRGVVDIQVNLPRTELVVVKVMDSHNQPLRVVTAGHFEAGPHVWSWDHRDREGRWVEGKAWRIDVEEGLPLGDAAP